LSLENRTAISNLQTAIWKIHEAVKLAGAEEGDFTFIHGYAIIEVLEQQIEDIWNGH
jgi:hypothetical protein